MRHQRTEMMDKPEYQRPVCAICGQNPVLPAGRVGCGQPIYTCAEVYRCTDCGVPFHRECAVKHFGEHVPHNGEVRGASRHAGEASSAEGATSTVVLEGKEET